jgi:hypothetical protein
VRKAADAIVALADEAAIELLVAWLGEELPERYSYTDDSAEEPPALDGHSALLYRADHPHSGTTYRMVRGTITDAAPTMGKRRYDTLAIEEKARWQSVGAWRTFMRER